MIFMKKFKDKIKDKAGFTLVELIVVIAILGILAAVAVPAYTGYVKKAKNANDLQILSSVATAVNGEAAAEGEQVTQIKVSKDGIITVTVDSGNTIKMDEVYGLMGYANADAAKSGLAGQFKGGWENATMAEGSDGWAWTLS